MTVQKKFFWKLNAIISAIVFIVLAIVFCYRYYAVGYPVEANWTEEILKYVVMWPALSIVCWGTFYVPVRAYSSYLAKKHGEEER